MAKQVKGKGVGARVLRKEDARHLRGRGTFVADVHVPCTLEAAFVRSPTAHARLRGMTRPEGSAGRLFAAADFPNLTPIRAVPTVSGFKASDYPPLATDKVRFVGEVIAICLGATRAEAEDLAQGVVLDLQELPAVVDGRAALTSPTHLHDHWGDNVYIERGLFAGDIEKAAADAPVKVARDYRMARQASVPMEGRGCLAHLDERLDELVVYLSCQSPHLFRVGLAEVLDIPERRLRVVAPDVGGGFGGKNRLMPEEIAVCAAALRLRRPVRWIEDRREHMVAAMHAREHIYRVTAYADARGLLLGLDAEIIVDSGAYSMWPGGPFIEAGMAMRNVPGPYRVPAYRVRTFTVATNKSPLGPYRGVARPGACYAIERTIDEVAHAVGREPLEVRRENMVRPDQMPYRTIAGLVFDNGDYPAALERSARLVDFAGVRRRQREPARDGRLIGVGFATYAEQAAHGAAEWAQRGTPIIPGYEVTTARLLPDGSLVLLVGIQSHGQGMETTLAQIACEELGVDPADVAVRHGDTAVSPFGMGTYASRSMTMSGGATAAACRALRAKLARIAGHLLQCASEDVVFRDGRMFGPSEGELARSVSFAEVGRVGYLRQHELPAGTEPTLEAAATWQPEVSTGVYSYASHAAVVAVDPATGDVEILDYAVVEDCGTVVNPMIVDGQIAGGVAQGIGTALYEEIPYDESGQPLATTFADYLVPGAVEIPAIKLGHMATPATSTAYGIKGMGEGGAIAPPAAVANAVVDALSPLGPGIGAAIGETPLSPRRVLAAIERTTTRSKPG
jgi:carbon-monoxide dehydrogenase large subunit